MDGVSIPWFILFLTLPSIVVTAWLIADIFHIE